MSVQYFEGIGRRKASTARVRIMSGEGRFLVNDKEGVVFFLAWVMWNYPGTAGRRSDRANMTSPVVNGGGVPVRPMR
jgi:small subunit ribosomal protein S9